MYSLTGISNLFKVYLDITNEDIKIYQKNSNWSAIKTMKKARTFGEAIRGCSCHLWTDFSQKPSFFESNLFPLVLISVAHNIGHCLYNQPSICHKSGAVKHSETFFWMDYLESFDFSEFIIFSDDPKYLIVIFCHLFELQLVLQCCDTICEQPLSVANFDEEFSLDMRQNQYGLQVKLIIIIK